MKTIYMRDILKDLWKNKLFVAICLLCCIGVGAFTGYKKSDFYDRISSKDKIKVEKYYDQLEKYEEEIKTTEKSIKLLDEKIASLQNYVDNSILMHLNPDTVYKATSQFTTSDIIIKANILQNKYWDEILSFSNRGDTYIISVMHSTEEQAMDIISAIIDNLKAKYEISTPTIACCIKAETSIIDKQKEITDQLSGFIKNRTDLENSLKKQKAFASKYKSEEKPKVLLKKELRPISVIFRYTLFNFVAGILGLIALFTIKRILC